MGGLAKRRVVGVTGVLLLLMSLTLAIGLPAGAVDGNCNAANGWEENPTSGPWGGITNNGDGSVSVTLNPGYSLDLCVKGGSGYEVYHLTSSGGPFWPPANCGQGNQQCGLSHWAIRNVTLTTTTTVPSTTTTTPTTTTSTTAPTTTTSTTAPTTTTSTTAPTTTTTAPTTTTTQATTTTTQGTTTTSEASTTTSTIPFDSVPDVSVQGIQATAPVAAQVGPTTAETLPFTGASTGSMAGLAAALAAGGAILLVASRRVDEKSTERSWN